MSVEVTPVIESTTQVETSDNFQSAPKSEQSEKEDLLWGKELTDFVAANAYKLVDCPWQPGLKMTISTLSCEWQYHVTLITKENFYSILSIFQQLIENESQETDEEQDIDLVGDDPEAIDSYQLDSNPQPAAEIVKQSNNEAAKTKPAPKIIDTQHTTTNTPTLPIAQPIVVNTISTPYSSLSTENITPPTAEKKHSNTVQSKIDVQPYPETQLPAVEVTNFEPVLVTPQETEQELTVTVAEELERADFEQPTTFVINEPVAMFAQEHTVDIRNVSFGVETDSAEAATQKVVAKQTDASFITENIEAEQQIPQHELVGSDDSTQANNMLVKIVEATEQSEPETAQNVYDIMSKIIDIASVIDTEDGLSQEQAKEEAVVLLSELLDILDMDHEPEVLESLVQLVLNTHAASSLENLAETDEPDESLQGSAVSKIVQQLTITLAHIKAVVDRNCSAIGKSALKHYGLHFAYTD